MKRFTTMALTVIMLLAASTLRAADMEDMMTDDMTASMAKSYEIDAAHSTLGFAIKHLGIGTTRGSFGTFEGNIVMDAEDPDAFDAVVTIDAGSIDTKNEGRDKHLRSDDFFGVETYPEISFKATGLKKEGDGAVITGKLTMKDVTRTVSIPVEISGPVTSPFGGEVIAIRGEFQLNRQDYNINWSKTMDSGGLVVADMVNVIVEIEAHHKG
ncbi:MAG: YceI family protein [Candidatus Omnitrophica bacterium]|nr:YceI family protein [Candidatus Omnitrophota bacterium]MCB9721091.1 YceI family protein [Candidatus Omnitrophota bacterium]